MLEDVSYLLEDGRVRRAAQELGGTGVSHGIAEFVLGQMNAKERNGRNPRLLPLGEHDDAAAGLPPMSSGPLVAQYGECVLEFMGLFSSGE